MRPFKVPGAAPTPRTGLSRAERRKIIGLLLGVLLVVFVMLKSAATSREYREGEGAELPGATQALEERIELPEIDPQRLDSLVRDGEPLERVVLEPEAVDAAIDVVRRLTPRHFEALGTEELDPEGVARILANPSAYRGRPFFARGRVTNLRTRRRGPDRPVEHIGRLNLDDETAVYFLVLDCPEDPTWLRVDGLFLKVYSEELFEHPGQWVDGPLLVGPRAIRTYRSLGVVEDNQWMAVYEVEDADLTADPPVVVRETPFEPFWHLMAYARDLPEDAIPWNQAPELDAALLEELRTQPDKWRYQPIRIPISRIQDARVLRAGENPARIDRFTQGWIGNTTWNNVVVHFKAPWVDEDLAIGDYVTGRGFFLHEFAYDSRARDLRTAPVFVLQALERFEPHEDPGLVAFAYWVAGGAILLAIGFSLLVLQDRRKSRRLQEELLRRRRARRARHQGGDRGGVDPATP